MKELVEVIAKSLVEHPDEVVVTENEKDDAVIIELKVGPSDMGKVTHAQKNLYLFLHLFSPGQPESF